MKIVVGNVGIPYSLKDVVPFLNFISFRDLADIDPKDFVTNANSFEFQYPALGLKFELTGQRITVDATSWSGKVDGLKVTSLSDKSVVFVTYSDMGLKLGDFKNFPAVITLDGNDRITGGALFDQLYGYGGDDWIDGAKGGDRIAGGNGSDTLIGGGGLDTLFGEGQNDILRAGHGADLFYGGNGDDKMNGGSGSDTLYGDDGIDDIDGMKDNDIAYGGDGSDHLTGRSGGDQLYGDAGHDYIRGGNGFDWLYGGAGNDLLRDGDQPAALAFDMFYGGSGDDIIEGFESDHMSGGDGRDIFQMIAPVKELSLSGGIMDFESGRDTIKLAFDVYTGLGPYGPLAQNRLVEIDTVKDPQGNRDYAQILYDHKGYGTLYYDPDGSGSQHAKIIGRLENAPEINYKDFFLN